MTLTALQTLTGWRGRALVAVMLALGALGCSASPALAATPTVESILPTTGPTAGGQKVTITGTYFSTGATTVKFIHGAAEHAVSGTWKSATSITATTPAAAAGSYEVSVTDSNGTGTSASEAAADTTGDAAHSGARGSRRRETDWNANPV